MNEWTAFVVTLMLAFVWIKAIEFFVHKKWVSGKLSRKIIHIGTGPLFVLCWLLFPATGYSNLLAAVIPLLITLQFFLVGSGVIEDPQLIESMSRTGNRREILKGPLYYGIVFVLITVMIWYHHPAGIIALMVIYSDQELNQIIFCGQKGKLWADQLPCLLVHFYFHLSC